MTKISTAEIICVGTELLLGQIINSNAAWLAQRLSDLGISSYYQTVVGDNRQRLLGCLETAAGRSDLILITGGLGPTQDDLTMSVAAEFAGRELCLHEPSRKAIADYFTRLGRFQVCDNNWKQAMLPQGALILPNNNGTAPGAIIEAEKAARKCFLALLPGPPSEMRLMFAESVQPWLAVKTSTRLRHTFIRMIGVGESSAESALLDLIESQQNPTIAPYASEGEVVFRVTQYLRSEADPDMIPPLLARIKERLGEFIYEIGQRKLPEVVKDLLDEKKLTLSVAESCTAGLVAAAITEYPGSSRIFKGGITAYANSVKEELLRVDPQIIKKYGAVSAECAVAMAKGCRDVLKTDIAAAVTGIAGPEGGTGEKPVGTVFIAVADSRGEMVKMLSLGGNRQRIRNVSALNVFALIRQHLLK